MLRDAPALGLRLSGVGFKGGLEAFRRYMKLRVLGFTAWGPSLQVPLRPWVSSTKLKKGCSFRKLQVGSLGYVGLLQGFYKVYRPSIRLLQR